MATSNITIIPASAPDAWMEMLRTCTQYDFYSLPGYHRLAELQGEGKAMLFVYTENQYSIAVPLLIRPIANIPGLETTGRGWYDATSVYGYVGPIASHADIPASVLTNFRRTLYEHLYQQRVVSLFGRCHPLINQEHLLDGLGEQIQLGHTVSICSTTKENLLLSQYRANHRTHINRLRRRGINCVWYDNSEQLDSFISLYHETMNRVQAADIYYFDTMYFQQLWELNYNFAAAFLHCARVSLNIILAQPRVSTSSFHP